MSYKTELHCHTSEVSICSHVETKKFVERYIKAGYSTLVITNHYSEPTFKHMENATWKEKNDFFLSAYHIAKKAAKDRINILLGMELRNNFSSNDYLLYGITEEFIYKYSNDETNLIDMKIKDIAAITKENGILLFQAHPFRDNMTVINPEILDGIEVLNGHRRHDSRNDIASMWADKFSLLRCGGSDCHEKGDEATVALYTDDIITTNEQLVEMLKKDVILK